MKEKFARWDTLFVQYLKRDWKKMIAWILGLGLFSAAFVPAFEEITKGQGLLGMYETLQNPAMTYMVGPTPIETAANYTLGALYSYEILLFCALFAVIITVLHLLTHTHKEVALSLTDLFRSFQVGRQAYSLSKIIESILISVIMALFISVVMFIFGSGTFSVEGSF